MLVLITESMGNMMAIHETIEKEVEGIDIRKGLMAYGVSTFMEGIIDFLIALGEQQKMRQRNYFLSH